MYLKFKKFFCFNRKVIEIKERVILVCHVFVISTNKYSIPITKELPV